MGALRKLQSRVVSFLLALVMIVSSVPLASAENDINNNRPGGGGAPSVDNTNWDNGKSFIRATILFAENSNWEDGNVIQIGKTVDIVNVDDAPNFTIELCANRDKESVTTNYSAISAPAYNAGEPIQFGWYRYAYDTDYFTAWPIPVGVDKETAEKNKANGGPTMEFPTLVGKSENGVDPNTYFTQYYALEELLWRTNLGAGQASTVTSTDMQNGVYKDARGNTRYGQYIIVLETGLYVLINYHYAALTTREAMLVDDLGYELSTWIYSKWTDPANAMYVKKWWPMIGLNGTYGVDKIGNFWETRETQETWLKDKFGVGVIEFKSVEKDPIPVVNYYYDLDEEDFTSVGLKIEYETDEKTGEKTAKVVDSEGNQITTYDLMYEYGEIFARKADNAKKISNTNTEYTAKADDGGYQLVAGYMTNKEIIGGNLSLEGSAGLCLVDISGKVMETITEKIKAKTSNNITTADEVKQWSNSIYLATDSEDNAKVSGLARNRDNIQNIGDGKLSAEFGNGIDSLQAVFLYVKSTVPIPPPTDDDDTDEDITIVVKNRKTTVTKMYYDSEDAEEPSEVVTDKISIFDTYQVKDEELDGESYKMVEWVIVPDETDGEAEGYKTWEEVKEHQAEGKDNN